MTKCLPIRNSANTVDFSCHRRWVRLPALRVPLPDTAVQHKPAHRLHPPALLPKSFSDRASSSLSILCSRISLRIVSSCLILSSVFSVRLAATFDSLTIECSQSVHSIVSLYNVLVAHPAPVHILALRLFPLPDAADESTSSTAAADTP